MSKISDGQLTYYYSGQGELSIATRDDTTGDPLGFSWLGNVAELKITASESKTDHKESFSGQRAIDKSFGTETTIAMEFIAENFSAANLQRFLRGTENDIVAGGIVAGEYKAYLGKGVSLGYVNVSSVIVNKDATPLVAYVDENTAYDYKVNEVSGTLIFAETPDTAGLVDGDDLTVDFSYDAQKKVDALTTASQEYYFRFEGLNTIEDDDPVVVNVFKVQTDILAELNLIADDIQQNTVTGTILYDSLRTSGSNFFETLSVQ